MKKTISDIVDMISAPSLNLNTSNKIKELLKIIGKQKKVLDLGSGKKRVAPEAINIDIVFSPNVDIIGNIHNLPFKDEYFDLLIARAVLEHVKNPMAAVAEMRRVLKKDGYIYAEIPFLQPYHGAPGDFQRYTLDGIDSLFKDFEKIESGVCVGPTGAMLGLMHEYAAFLVGIPILRTAVYIILGWLLFPFKYLDLLLIKRRKAHLIASSLYFVGEK